MINSESLDTRSLWGEINSTRENVLDLSSPERESLMKLCRPLAVEGPKFHSPLLVKQNEIKLEQTTDPIIDHTIQLLEYKRVVQILLDTVREGFTHLTSRCNLSAINHAALNDPDFL